MTDFLKKAWAKLKEFWAWFIESKAWLFVAGLASAVAAALVFAARRPSSRALQRNRDLRKERQRIRDETSAKVDSIDAQAEGDLAKVDRREQEEIQNAENQNRAGLARKAKDIDEKYDDLDDDDATRRHLRGLLDDS